MANIANGREFVNELEKFKTRLAALRPETRSRIISEARRKAKNESTELKKVWFGAMDYLENYE